MDPASFTAIPNRQDRGGASVAADYAALRNGVGVRVCAERILVRMGGDDRASFLHGMCSNNIEGLNPGELVAGLFLTERAHLIADTIVWATTDALLLEMERPLWPEVRAHLERFLVADDVEMEESGKDAKYGSVIQVDGPRAAQAVAAVLGERATLSGAWRYGEADGALVSQVTRWGAPAFTILAEHGSTTQIVERLVAAGAEPVSIEAVEIIRVECGVARAGVDTNDKTIALEARMETAISFNKGCYIGQETIERATARGALKRRLMGLKIRGERVPAADARVMLADKEVGHLSSPVRSPRLGVLGLGILHYSAQALGTAVTIHDADGELSAAVCELPFANDG